MVNEITVDARIEVYAEEFIPLVLKMNEFITVQTALFDEFNSYRGKARNEVETYKQDVIGQLVLLSNNYTCLAENLLKIVLAFLELDSNAESKINAFQETIINNYNSLGKK